MMVSGKKIVNRPVFLRASYDKEVPYTQQYEAAYKTWFVGMLFNINWYAELLHKQLVRKGRCAKRNFSAHPLFKDAYIVEMYNIKSPSKNPYDRHSHDDLGLNQFFVGQDPKKSYDGDPGDDNGIYHDTSEIVPKRWVSGLYSSSSMGILRAYEFKIGVPLIADISFYGKYKKELKEIYYNTGFKLKDYLIIAKPRFENDKFKAWAKDEIVIPDEADLKEALEAVNKQTFTPDKEKSEYQNLRDEVGFNDKKAQKVQEIYLNALQKINKDKALYLIKETFKIVNFKQHTNDGSGNYDKVEKEFGFLKTFEEYKKIYTKFCFRVMIFNGDLTNVIYEQAVVAIGRYAYPLYRQSSDSPFGRVDRWFILWDEFYELFVEEETEKWQELFVPVMIIVLVVITIVTYGAASAAVAAGISAVTGATAATATAIAGALIITSTALSVASLMAMGAGNQSLADALGLAGAVVGLVTAVAGGIGAVNEAMKQGATQASTSTAAFEVAKLTGETLMSGYNLYNSIKAVTADTPSLLEEEKSEDEEFFGKDDEQEQEKDELKEFMDMFKHWYDLEGEDFTNEALKSALAESASALKIYEPVNYALDKKLAFRL